MKKVNNKKDKSLSSSDSEEAKIIDQSLEEINKVTNFAIEKIESEDMETANKLRALGCNYAQGYIFSHPLTAEDFEQQWLT